MAFRSCISGELLISNYYIFCLVWLLFFKSGIITSGVMSLTATGKISDHAWPHVIRLKKKKQTNLYACFWTQLERTNSKEYSFVIVLVVKTKLFAKFLLLGTFIQYWPFQTRSRVRENYTHRKKSFKGTLRNIPVTLFALLNENCCRSTLFIEFFFSWLIYHWKVSISIA